VDGPSLSLILGTSHEKLLLELACSCAAVVACRVSPAQKQLIVKMVKEGLPNKPITLSIGDGANDVPMIQEAQIGVGISGKEGRQAVNSSDFAIAQFRFLEPLLLVHGRWNYRRIAKVVLYSFYKNIVLTIVLLWWTMDCGYSGQSLYESYIYAAYNFFLGLPILFLGIFDQVCSHFLSLNLPYSLSCTYSFFLSLSVEHKFFDSIGAPSSFTLLSYILTFLFFFSNVCFILC